MGGHINLSSLPAQASSRLRSIQAVFSWICSRWVSRSAVGSSWASAAMAKTLRMVRALKSEELALLPYSARRYVAIKDEYLAAAGATTG